MVQRGESRIARDIILMLPIAGCVGLGIGFACSLVSFPFVERANLPGKIYQTFWLNAAFMGLVAYLWNPLAAFPISIATAILIFLCLMFAGNDHLALQ